MLHSHTVLFTLHLLLALLAINAKERQILIDIGANCGDSYKKLLREYPIHAESANTEIFLFEANPITFKHFLSKLPARDPRVKVYPYAVRANSTASTRMTFTIYYGKSMEQYKDQEIQQMTCHENSILTGSLDDGDYRHGGKLYKVDEDGKTKLRQRKSRKVSVEVVNLKEWLRDLSLDKSDSVILKMDVEGSEFGILQELMTEQNLFCLVDMWHVEFHLTNTEMSSVDDKKAIRKSFLDKVRACGTLYGHWD
jgi:FkbM family methyltransferase